MSERRKELAQRCKLGQSVSMVSALVSIQHLLLLAPGESASHSAPFQCSLLDIPPARSQRAVPWPVGCAQAKVARWSLEISQPASHPWKETSSLFKTFQTVTANMRTPELVLTGWNLSQSHVAGKTENATHNYTGLPALKMQRHLIVEMLSIRCSVGPCSDCFP